MKIQFGTPPTLCHVHGTILLGCIVLAISWFNVHLQSLLGEAEESILRSRGLNVTHTAANLQCDLPYDDCLCLVFVNKSGNSESCITNSQLVGSRILPLVSFFLQIFLVQELFSLNANHHHVIIYALWIVSTCTFVAMTISIYWSSCYHAYITLILGYTGGSLWFLSFHNLIVKIDRIPSSSNRNKIAAVQRSKTNDNPDRAWQELP
jgi:hypothetical protein